MSDLFRVPIPPEIQEASFALLAILAHQAEDTDDDVLLMQVMGEVERRDAMVPPSGITQYRPKRATAEFMVCYRAAMEVRIARNRRAANCERRPG